jgi:hypothetical protein
MAAKKQGGITGRGQDILLKIKSLGTHFLQLGPTFHSSTASQVYPNFEFINELNHLLGQSPHNLILTANTLTDTSRDMLYYSSRCVQSKQVDN